MDDRGALLRSWEWSTGTSIDSVTLFERELSWTTRESGFSMFETGESQTLENYIESGPIWEAPAYILRSLNEAIEQLRAHKKKGDSESGK